MREELTRLPQPSGIVGEERPVDQIGDSLAAVDPPRIDAITSQKPARLVRRVSRTGPLALLGRPLLIGFRTGGRRPGFLCRAVPRCLESTALASSAATPAGIPALLARHGSAR